MTPPRPHPSTAPSGESDRPGPGTGLGVHQGSRQYRVLIVSNDEYNEQARAMPWALVVQRDAPKTPGNLIEMANGDPLPGAVVAVPLVLRCDPTGLRRNLGFVQDDTLNTVEQALRDLLALP